jgi:hypothetical protein
MGEEMKPLILIALMLACFLFGFICNSILFKAQGAYPIAVYRNGKIIGVAYRMGDVLGWQGDNGLNEGMVEAGDTIEMRTQ